MVEWQKMAPNGICYPWWTHPCLDILETWELSNKIWLEFGVGFSTSWLRSKCAWVDSIESNIDWAAKGNKYCDYNKTHNGIIWVADLPDGIQERKQEYFDLIPKNYGAISSDQHSKAVLKDRIYDIISVDGIWRNECLEWAIDHFKGREGKLIVDNLDQDFVWISPAAMELMAPYPCEIYYQPGHINHEGKPWSTRIYTIPA